MLLKGECIQEMNNKIPDKSVDLILCDLPYGTTACKWDNIIPFDDLWKQYNRIIKDTGNIILFASQPFTTKLINSNIDNFRYEIIWLKDRPSNILLAKKQILKYHENILVFYKKLGTYNPQMVIKEEKNRRKNNLNKTYKSSELYNNKSMAGDGNTDYTYPKSVIKFNKTQNNIHPTQKPVDLLEYLINTYSNANELVLDNCAGSGATGIACIKTNRDYILIEQDLKNCDLIEKRITNYNLTKKDNYKTLKGI